MSTTMMRMLTLSGVLVIGLGASSPARAGCGGGGGSRGGYGGAHTFAAPSYGGGCGGACMNMGGMNMAGMNMAGMNMPAANMQAMPGMAMQPQPMAAPRSAANAAPYTCPMHPSVVSNGPGSCPICHMALTRK